MTNLNQTLVPPFRPNPGLPWIPTPFQHPNPYQPIPSGGMTPEQERKLDQLIKLLEQQKPKVAPNGKKETHIGVCLDSSGSMESIKNEIMGAYNAASDQLKEDAEKLGDVTVTLVTFGEAREIVSVKYRFEPLDKLVKLTAKTYKPEAMTPFYDGLGTLLTILEEKDFPDGTDRAFLVNVYTDGLENASKEWINGRIKTKVEALQARGNWTITYAGANVNLDQVAQDVGLHVNNMSGFEASSAGVRRFTGQNNSAMSSYSASRGSGNLSVKEFYTTDAVPDWPATVKNSTLAVQDKDEDDDNSLV